MATITSFTRESLKLLRADIDAALAQVAAKHGIALASARCTFSSDNFKLAVEGATKQASGEVNTPEAASFNAMAAFYRLKPENLGASVRIEGEEYRISGLRPNAKKRPICLTRVRDGQRIVASAECVVRALNQP